MATLLQIGSSFVIHDSEPAAASDNTVSIQYTVTVTNIVRSNSNVTYTFSIKPKIREYTNINSNEYFAGEEIRGNITIGSVSSGNFVVHASGVRWEGLQDITPITKTLTITENNESTELPFRFYTSRSSTGKTGVVNTGASAYTIQTLAIIQTPYNVNINNAWASCTIKVNVVGEGYEYIGLTSDFRDLQSCDEDMYYQYGIPLQGNEDIFTAVQTGHYPEYGVSVDSIPDNSWGGYDGEIVPWELYMKSNNVKQWVDCTIQGI